MSTASESRLRGRAARAGDDHRTPHSSCDRGLADDEGTVICMRGPLRSAPAGRPTRLLKGGREKKKRRQTPRHRSKASLVTKSEVCRTPTPPDWVSKGPPASLGTGQPLLDPGPLTRMESEKLFCSVPMVQKHRARRKAKQRERPSVRRSRISSSV